MFYYVFITILILFDNRQKHGTTSKPLKAVRLDSEEQAKIAKSGLEMKLITSEMDAETDKWQENSTQLEVKKFGCFFLKGKY